MFGLAAIDIAVIIGYFAVVIAIGVWASRRIKNQTDYFLAGRKFGKFIRTFAAFGQGTSADNAVGVTTTTFSNGIAGVWSSLLYLFATPMYWMVMPWMRRLRLISLGDFFEARYGSKRMAGLYAVIGVIGMMTIISVGFAAMTKTVVALTPKAADQLSAAENAEYAQAMRWNALEAKEVHALSAAESAELEQLRIEKPRKMFFHLNPDVLIWVVCVVVIFFLLPMTLPNLAPSLRTNAGLLKTTEAHEVTREYTATQMDVEERPADLKLGDTYSRTYTQASKSIFWTKGIKVNGEGQKQGSGMLSLELVLLDKMGCDLGKNPYALNETIRILIRTIVPFLILVGVSPLTRRDDKAVLDRFFVKMKTPVESDPKEDARQLKLSYADPHRFDDRNLFGPRFGLGVQQVEPDRHRRVRDFMRRRDWCDIVAGGRDFDWGTSFVLDSRLATSDARVVGTL